MVTVRDMIKLIFEGDEKMSFMIQDRRSVVECNEKFNVSINFLLFTVQKNTTIQFIRLNGTKGFGM